MELFFAKIGFSLFIIFIKTLHERCRSSPLKVFLRKSWCSENMQQIYRTAPMPKCDFNSLRHGCSPVILLDIFQNTFSYEHLCGTASVLNTPLWFILPQSHDLTEVKLKSGVNSWDNNDVYLIHYPHLIILLNIS